MFGSYEAFFNYILSMFPEEPSYYSWSLSPNQKQATYSFYKQPAITLKLSGKVQYIKIPAFLIANPEDVSSDYEIKEKGKVIRFSLDSLYNMATPSALPKLIKEIDVYCRRSASSEPFSCCNDFIRCSDAKKCLHPNEYFYLGCLYRDNLENGKMFYGANINM